MPEITIVGIVLLTLAILAGILIGWVSRGRRADQEKANVSSGWKEQIAALRTESKRLVDQNKGLMEQVSQLQASNKDATNRARELSGALKEAFARRDQLQREIKDIRGNLESMLAERKRLESDVQNLAASDSSNVDALRNKDEKIFKLSRELDSWHERLPPLIKRFQERDTEARQLEEQLAEAQQEIFTLKDQLLAQHTLVESTESTPMSDALLASNDTIDRRLDEDDDYTFEADTAFSGEPVDAASVESDVHDNEQSNGTGFFSVNGAEFAVDSLQDESDAGTTTSRADDLKRIKGIGPAIEKTLHELGIFSFAQIAGMSEFEIDRVANHLKGFHSRIYREDWIGQARQLLARSAD